MYMYIYIYAEIHTYIYIHIRGVKLVLSTSLLWYNMGRTRHLLSLLKPQLLQRDASQHTRNQHLLLILFVITWDHRLGTIFVSTFFHSKIQCESLFVFVPTLAGWFLSQIPSSIWRREVGRCCRKGDMQELPQWGMFHFLHTPSPQIRQILYYIVSVTQLFL